MSKIVVGDDSSVQSMAAVREALVLGRAMQLPVVVVHAFSMKEALGDKHAAGAIDPIDQIEARFTERMTAHLEALMGEFADVEIILRAEQGNPATVLLEEGEGARFIVVGSRGLGGLSRLLGSVSEKVVGHAKTTVVVVRDPGA